MLGIIPIHSQSFFKHARNYLGGDVLFKVIGLLTVPIFTRILTKTDYGTFEIFSSIVMLGTVLIGLNLHGSIVLYYNENNSDFTSFQFGIMVFSIGLGILEISLAYIFKNTLSALFGTSWYVLICALLVSLFQIPFSFHTSSLQARQQSAIYVRVNTIVKLSIVPLSILFVLLLKDNKYRGQIGAQLLISGIVFAIIVVIYFKKYRCRLRWNQIKFALLFGIPLIPHTLSGFINQFFDKIMISKSVNVEYAGIYSLAVTTSSAIRLISMSMNKAWVPGFYKNMSNHEYSKIQVAAIAYYQVFIIISILFLLFFKEAFYILVDRKFVEAIEIIPILILSNTYGPLYTLYANHSFYCKKTLLISISTLMSALLNVILNLIFIPRFGYSAAAYTTLVSVAGNFLFHYFVARFVLHYDTIKLFSVLKYNLVAVFAVVTVMIIHALNLQYLLDLGLRVGLMVIIAIVLFVIVRSDHWRMNLTQHS